MGAFHIGADRLCWIGGAADDPADYCLHGHVTVEMGDISLEFDGTVSAAALNLLKTLTQDKIMNRWDIQMVPCCGHFLIASADLQEVEIIGCDSGLDWSVIHEGGRVRFILPSGHEEAESLGAYREEVFRFVDKIEAHYLACRPKERPRDDFDRNGYIAFWNEWYRRRGKAGPLPLFQP